MTGKGVKTRLVPATDAVTLVGGVVSNIVFGVHIDARRGNVAVT